MADEPRRSGRATKGQHTKGNDEAEPVKKPRGKAGRPSKASKAEEEEEEEAIIRCICGYVKEDKRDKRAMICCDQCSAWQHNVCMGLSDDDDELPDSYFCEQCKPHDHKETLAAIAKGEKIWEEREARHKREKEEEKANKRKGGRKSKGGRPSEVKDAREADAPQSSPVAPPPAPQADGGQKRKLPLEVNVPPAGQEQGAAKLRKVSMPKAPLPKTPAFPPKRKESLPQRGDSKAEPLQFETVDRIEDLKNRSRQNGAKGLVGKFIEFTKQAIQEGKFSLPPAQKVDDFGYRLGLAVEYALFMNHWGSGAEPQPTYGEKLRSILHNVKNNPRLRDNVLTGYTSPNDLTKMSTEQMMRQDLKEETAQMQKEAEKQHILKQEEGARLIRRTHKGDEVVGEEEPGANESIYANVTRRESGMDGHMSPEVLSPHSPRKFEPGASHPLTVDTKPPASGARTASGNFDPDHVWSGGPSPSEAKHHHRHDVAMHDAPSPTGPSSADPDIARLLHDQEDDDEPYSPKEYPEEPPLPADGTVWRGRITMPTVADFRGAARHVAGADLSTVLPWPRLFPAQLTIDGRIAVGRASEYLCGLQWSKTTDVTVVAVTPANGGTEEEDDPDRVQFDKLFDYFVSRARYGVVSEALNRDFLKDVYIIPLERGTARKPDFIELLESCAIPDDRPERTLLVTFVVKTRDAAAGGGGAGENNATASAQATPRHPDAAQFMSPVAHPSAFGGSGQPQPQPTAFAPPPQRVGMDAARHVLGPLAEAPAVAQLVQMAPDSPEASFVHIKPHLEARPELRTDMGALLGVLQQAMQGAA